MKKFMGYALVTVKGWYRDNEKIFLLTEEGLSIEYFGIHSLSQLWLKARKGRKTCVGIVNFDGTPGCILVADVVSN